MSCDNKVLVRKWFDEVWCQHRPEVIVEMSAPDMIAHNLGDGTEPFRGPAPFVEFHRKFVGAFPDLRITVEEVIAEGDLTAARIAVTGTHTGEGLDLPPTGRPVQFEGMTFVRWKDGLIAEGWNVVDFATMMRQLSG